MSTESSHPERLCKLLLATMLASAFPCAIFGQDVGLQTDMPITLDADSSEFDYDTSRLLFRGLRMSQGTLSIESDLAETDKLDFEDGLWIFTGNVRIDSGLTVLYCDQAELKFVDHGLRRADLTGNPARFEQPNEETGNITEGQARLIVYDVNTGRVKMTDEARFSDGGNEITGASITYDVVKRHVMADSDSSGPVKILIEPPAKTKP